MTSGNQDKQNKQPVNHFFTKIPTYNQNIKWQ